MTSQAFFHVSDYISFLKCEVIKCSILQLKNYFHLITSLNCFKVMKAHECYQLVFSSSCCVYGNPAVLPITEDSPIGNVTNVYGRTKYVIEEMLMDLSRSDEVIMRIYDIIFLKFSSNTNFFLDSVGISAHFDISILLVLIRQDELARIRPNLIPT